MSKLAKIITTIKKRKQMLNEAVKTWKVRQFRHNWEEPTARTFPFPEKLMLTKINGMQYLSLLLLRWTKSGEYSCLWSHKERRFDCISQKHEPTQRKNVCTSDRDYHVRKTLNENGCETLPTRRSQTVNKAIHGFRATWISAPTFSLKKNQCWEFCLFTWLSRNS